MINPIATIELDGEPIAIRQSVEDDLRFVMQTWVRSYKSTSRINETIYDKEHPELIKRILSDAKTRLVVACSPDVESAIHGWACGDARGLHYVYVPMAFRGRGVARELIQAVMGNYPSKIHVSHRFHSPSANNVRFVFNPYRLGVVL